MQKKTTIIITIIFLLILGGFLALARNKNYAIVDCNNLEGKCNYFEKNIFGSTKNETTFAFNEVIQCYIEGVYKNEDETALEGYKFYLYLLSENEPINFQTRQIENLDKICMNFFEKKSFNYKFPISENKSESSEK